MAAQKYVRLKADGRVIDIGINLRIIPEEMEVFECDGPPPEIIPNMMDFLMEEERKKARAAIKAEEKQLAANAADEPKGRRRVTVEPAAV